MKQPWLPLKAKDYLPGETSAMWYYHYRQAYSSAMVTNEKQTVSRWLGAFNVLSPSAFGS